MDASNKVSEVDPSNEVVILSRAVAESLVVYWSSTRPVTAKTPKATRVISPKEQKIESAYLGTG